MPRLAQALGDNTWVNQAGKKRQLAAHWPDPSIEAIKKHEVLVGMDRDAVLSAKGPPDRKVREVREGAEQEDWIYGLPPHSLFVTFDGDTVTAVHQY